MTVLKYYRYTYLYLKQIVRYVPIINSFFKFDLNMIKNLNSLGMQTELICKRNFPIYCPIAPIVYSSVIFAYPNIFINISSSHSQYLSEIKLYKNIFLNNLLEFNNMYKINTKYLLYILLNSKFLILNDNLKINILNIISMFMCIYYMYYIYMYNITYTCISSMYNMWSTNILNNIYILYTHVYSIQNIFILTNYQYKI